MKLHRRIVSALSGFALLGMSQMLLAAEPPAAVHAEIQQRFLAQFSGLRIDSVSDTPFEGLYEIRVGNTLLYTNEAVTYVIEGNLIDAASRRNLTAQRLEALNAINFADLPLELAFTQVRGDGSRHFAIFEDPNCGYCKQLRVTLQELDDVTIHTFMYPILSPDSHQKVHSIWCAEDAGATWDDWMLNGQVPPRAECGAPMDEFVALGRQLNVRGTPTLFFADGSRATGALPLAMLEDRLQRAER